MGNNSTNNDDNIIINGHTYNCLLFTYPTKSYKTKRNTFKAIKNIMKKLMDLNDMCIHNHDDIKNHDKSRIQLIIDLFQLIVVNKKYFIMNNKFRVHFSSRINYYFHNNYISKNNLIKWNEQFIFR
jgi:DNA-binding transcriptional regulator/RsmH inhibitor MraZ